MAVYEIQGLTACDGLPVTDVEDFYLTGVWQGGPNWNSFNNVTSTMSWSSGVNTQFEPRCSYQANAWTGLGAAFQWVY